MAGPVLVAIDDNPDLLRDVERELRDRYERHYRVICVGSDVGIGCLENLAAAGEDVALILAGQRLAGRSGAELLGEVRRIHPHAKHVLLIGWGEQGDLTTSEAIAHGRIDHYLVRPSAPPDGAGSSVAPRCLRSAKASSPSASRRLCG